MQQIMVITKPVHQEVVGKRRTGVTDVAGGSMELVDVTELTAHSIIDAPTVERGVVMAHQRARKNFNLDPVHQTMGSRIKRKTIKQ